jgi:hypothetical protein
MEVRHCFSLAPSDVPRPHRLQCVLWCCGNGSMSALSSARNIAKIAITMPTTTLFDIAALISLALSSL